MPSFARFVSSLSASLSLSMVLASAGCDLATYPPATTLDFAASTQDLSSPDLASAPDMNAGTSCLTIITCAAGCASKAACQDACAAQGAPASRARYRALFACAYAQCLPADGGYPLPDGGVGPGACASTMDTSMNCSNCVSVEAQSAACTQELNDCLKG